MYAAISIRPMPVDSSGSTKPADSPTATQFLHHCSGRKPASNFSNRAFNPFAAGPMYSRSTCSRAVSSVWRVE